MTNWELIKNALKVGEDIYFIENGKVKATKCLSIEEHGIKTESGFFIHEEHGKKWWLTQIIAQEFSEK